MTQRQLNRLAVEVARKFSAAPLIKRSDVIREVVRTNKLTLADSVIMADCIVKGLYKAGKTIVIQG